MIKAVILSLFCGICANPDDPDLSFLEKPEKSSGEHKERVVKILEDVENQVSTHQKERLYQLNLSYANTKKLNEQLASTNLKLL